MTNHSIPDISIDVIALETKLESDYQRSTKQEEYCQNYQDDPRTTFEDGLWDGYLNFEPEPYQWTSLLYKAGYLDGVAKKFDEQFAC
jgi:hypothetical protein